MAKWIEDTENLLAETQEDLSFRKAILDGSWPTAGDYANAILEKVRAIEDAEVMALRAAGKQAWTDQLALCRNPHPRESREAIEWEAGWKAEHWRMLKAKG